MANVSLRGLEKHRLGGKEDWYPVFVSVMGTRITLVFKHHLCGGICESQKARILESKYSKTLFKKQREKEREGKERERAIIPPLLHSPNIWGWARLDSRARNSIQVSHINGRDGGDSPLEPSPAPSQSAH